MKLPVGQTLPVAVRILECLLLGATLACAKSLTEHDIIADLLLNSKHQLDDRPQDLARLLSASASNGNSVADEHWIPMAARQHLLEHDHHHHQNPQQHQHSQQQQQQQQQQQPNQQHEQRPHYQQQPTASIQLTVSELLNAPLGAAELVSASSLSKPFAFAANTALAAHATPSHPSRHAQPPTPTTQRPCDRQRAPMAAASSETRHTATSGAGSPSGKPNASKSGGDDHDDDADDRDDGGDDDDDEPPSGKPLEGPETQRGRGGVGGSRASGRELLASNESVPRASALRPPPPGPLIDTDDAVDTSETEPQPRGRHFRHSASGEGVSSERLEGGELESGAGGEPDDSGEGQETPPDEAAERRAQEAAEASEAEAADRSALAEQQQAQREIILAQAESEAKAIREQQEALLRQQQLQQQILMRRHQNFLDETDKRGAGSAAMERPTDTPTGQQRSRVAANQRRRSGARRGRPSDTERDLMSAFDSTGHQFAPIDNQFSDQLDGAIVDRGPPATPSQSARHQQRPQQNRHQARNPAAEDELSGEYSMREPRHSAPSGEAAGQQLSGGQPLVIVASSVATNATRPASQESSAQPRPAQLAAKFNLTGTDQDLLAAAQQHSYGAHFGLLGDLDAHQHHSGGGGYYQFAESHKKGQFDSGFKRGNKKFTISGHSSQHKGHAEGHVKWKSKKGKGTHYWDYKHKNKKHYGTGDIYGGGHHHY